MRGARRAACDAPPFAFPAVELSTPRARVSGAGTRAAPVVDRNVIVRLKKDSRSYASVVKAGVSGEVFIHASKVMEPGGIRHAFTTAGAAAVACNAGL